MNPNSWDMGRGVDSTLRVWTEDVSQWGYKPGDTVWTVRGDENGTLQLVKGHIALWQAYQVIVWDTIQGTRDMKFLSDAFSKQDDRRTVFPTKEEAIAAAHLRVDWQHEKLDEMLLPPPPEEPLPPPEDLSHLKPTREALEEAMNPKPGNWMVRAAAWGTTLAFVMYAIPYVGRFGIPSGLVVAIAVGGLIDWLLSRKPTEPSRD